MGKKHEREIRSLAEELGWEEVERTDGGHFRIRHPNPEVDFVITGTTPSDPRWRQNLESLMKRKVRAAGAQPDAEPEEEQPEPDPEEAEPGPEDCPHCGAGPFPDGRKRYAHVDTCEQNPDRWHNCPHCHRPCLGERGLRAHLTHCDAAEEEEPAEAPDADAAEPEEERPEPEGVARGRVRSLLRDLLRQYDAARRRAEAGSMIDAAEEVLDAVDAAASLIVDEVRRADGGD